MKKKIHLLGTRGIPAAHGGFETFVQNLAPYLVKSGWEVLVYCQHQGSDDIYYSEYDGITLVHVSVRNSGTLGTIHFDWLSLKHALQHDGLLVSFGYPTGVFAILPKLRNRLHVINMDGIEWKRSQFGFLGRIWYYLNERAAAWLADRLIADHPEIKAHLSTRVASSKIMMVPYGAKKLSDVSDEILEAYCLERDCYGIVIARPEPDNSILEIVRSFSRRSRKFKLVVLGNFCNDNPYHLKVMKAASPQVIFPGAIYQQERLDPLRFYARVYFHGHKVGGTNPSLVEALGAGNAIVAKDNKFNKWVAQDAAMYFDTEDDLDMLIEEISEESDQLTKMRNNAKLRHEAAFEWDLILSTYNELFMELVTDE